MSYTKPRRYRAEPFGATAALPLTVVALGGLAALGALLVPELLAPAVPAKAAPQPEPTVTVEQVVPATAPAFDVVRAVVDTEPVWNQVLPLPFGCDGPDPVLSATGTHGAVVLGAFVMPAGGGSAALDSIRSCGRRTDVAGARAVRFAVDGGQVVLWSRGDVLVSVSAPAVDDAVLRSVDERLNAALAGTCVSAAPEAQDPSRNPVLGSYTPWTATAQVHVETAGLSVPGAPAAPTALELPVLPAGVAGPPLPEPVAAPAVPQHPGDEPLERSLSVPAVDVDGPGCGWAFTGATGPRVDGEAVEREAHSLITAQREQLEAEHAAWVDAVTAFTSALPTYEQELAAWEQYAAGVREVAASWSAQATAIDEHRRAVQRRDAQVRAHEAHLAAQAQAQADYDAALRACTTWQAQVDAAAAAPAPAPGPTATPGPTPAPSPTVVLPPEPAGGCPPARPGVLDQAPPSIDPEPAAPALWQPEG